jgi:hypothetical protein
MSALPPKADIPCRNLNVSFGPKTDIVTVLFGRFVGAGELVLGVAFSPRL